MNWMHQQIARLLANRRMRMVWALIVSVAVVCTAAGVSYAMVQGATALQGSLNAASAGVQTSAVEQSGDSNESSATSEESSESSDKSTASQSEQGESTTKSSTEKSKSSKKSTASKESSAEATVLSGKAKSAQKARVKKLAAEQNASTESNPDKGTLTGATFSVNRTGGGTDVLESGSKVDSGSRVQFALTFDFAAETFTTEDSMVTYTLPEELSVTDVQSGNIMGSSSSPTQAGKTLGTYRIEDGKLVMVFSQDQVSDLFSQGITTTVSFWATVSNSSLSDEKSIVFPGGSTLIVNPTNAALQVSKAASKVQGSDQWGNNTGDLADGDGNKNRHVEYTVTVGSTTGTGNTVTITDAFAGGSNVAADSYDTGSFKLMHYTSADDTTGTEVDIARKLAITNLTDGSHATFTLADLNALQAGERYVLTYKATVTETDHTADTSEVNNVTATSGSVSQSGTATTQWGNSGDIHISKSGQLTDYVNPDDAKEKRIQYRIKVWTNNGTVTRIQIGDTANNDANSGTVNIDTSAWNNTTSRNLFFDHDSFHLTRYASTADADADRNGTNADSYLTNLSFGADGSKPSLGLSISEPLQAGECYILTYTATVEEIDDNAPDTKMNNQAVARIYPGGTEQHTNQANAGVEWHNEIQKSGTFNQSTGYIDWNITVNRNNGDARGLAMDDVLPEGSALVSNVRVYTSNRSGGSKSLVRTIDLLNAEDNSVATDGFDNNPSTYDTSTRKLHVVLGSWASAKQSYTISFSTTAPADGTVSNQASVVVNGTTYGSQGVNVGVNRQTQWGIAKSAGTNASDNYDVSTGTYTFAWNATATFPDQDLSPDGDNGVLKLHDVFGEVTQGDGTSSSDYQGLHYAIAKDLYAELTGSSDSGTTVTLSLHRDTDANGNTRTYTLSNGVFTWTSGSETKTLDGVTVVPTFYDASGNVIDNPSTSKAHVKSFDLVLTCDSGQTINGQSLTIMNYHSVLDARTLPPSTQVQAGNSLSSNHTSSATTQSQSVTTMSNPMEKQVRTLDNRGDNNDSSFSARATFEADWSGTTSGDYDSISGKQHAAQFRIALNTTSYPDNAVVTITDTLPAGMKLATSTNNGTSNVAHPIRLVYGTNVGQSNASYTAKDTLRESTTSGTYLSYSTATNENGQQVITFTFDMSKSGLSKGQYYITYTASFVDDSAWDNLATANRTYTNTASAQVGAVTYTDEATLNITRTVSPVQKSQNGTLTNDRKGKYKIIINPGAVDLQEGSDTVTLVDELSGWNSGSNAGHMNPVLDLNSVHLYSYDNDAADGIGVEVPKASYNLKYEATDGTDGVRKITLTVPDATAFVLVYDYEFRATSTGDWGSQTNDTGDYIATVSNSATIAGQTSSQVSEQVCHAASEASATSRALYLYKVDADNYANTLTGSEFDLYKAKAQSSTWTNVPALEGQPYTGGYVGDEGTFQPYIDDLTGSSGVTEHDVLYAYVETKAPTGYERTVRYVVWLGQNESEDEAWTAIAGSSSASAAASQLDTSGKATGTAVSRTDVTFIPYTGGSLYIEDSYQSVTVTKNWSNADGAYLSTTDSDLPESITLQLKQSNDNGATWSNYGEPVTVTKPADDTDNWEHTWSGLPQADDAGNTYLYKVEETNVGDDWQATYTNNDGISKGNITITNNRQYSLPQTGGNPFLSWVCLGGGLMAAIAAAVLAVRRLTGR